MRVTVYLKTPLFAVGHVPEGSSVLDAELLHNANGGLELQVTGFRTGTGKVLDGSACRLLVPMGKVDHVALHEDPPA